MAKQIKDAQSRLSVRIEYPGEGEVIARGPYTFHVAASPGTSGVEISIDGGEWLPCREGLGLWWYDCKALENNNHELVVRARMDDGTTTDSAPRRFSAA